VRAFRSEAKAVGALLQGPSGRGRELTSILNRLHGRSLYRSTICLFGPIASQQLYGREVGECFHTTTQCWEWASFRLATSRVLSEHPN